jgi:hypothetical protein
MLASCALPASPLDRERGTFAGQNWDYPTLVWHFWPVALAIAVVVILALVYWARHSKPPTDRDDEQ